MSKSLHVTKIGHCCLLIKTRGVTILTDPGMFSSDQDNIVGIDIVLITHEHADHLHVDSLRQILKNNPKVKVFTNQSVKAILDKENIFSSVIPAGELIKVLNIEIQSFDGKHAEIFEEIGQVENSGFLLDNSFFYPGDSYTEPGVPVNVLALPVAGPWCKISDAINYALRINPQNAFPVHDGQLQKGREGANYAVVKKVLDENNIKFSIITDGESVTL